MTRSLRPRPTAATTTAPGASGRRSANPRRRGRARSEIAAERELWAVPLAIDLVRCQRRRHIAVQRFPPRPAGLAQNPLGCFLAFRSEKPPSCSSPPLASQPKRSRHSSGSARRPSPIT